MPQYWSTILYVILFLVPGFLLYQPIPKKSILLFFWGVPQTRDIATGKTHHLIDAVL